MSGEWTAERLDALPDFVVIGVRADEWARKAGHDPALLPDGLLPIMGVTMDEGGRGWLFDEWSATSFDVIAETEEIRIISVPIDALLSGETFGAISGRFLITDREVISAAIAHVTGES